MRDRDCSTVHRLTELTQPTLVLQGDYDVMIPTKASYTLAGLLPKAELVIHPDASRGAIFQCAAEVASTVSAFLSR